MKSALEYKDKPEKKALWSEKYPNSLPDFFRFDPYELSKCNGGRGSRTDIKRALGKYSSYEEFILAEPDLASRGRNVILDYYSVTRNRMHINRPITVTWIFGETGVGKSKIARILAEKLSGSNYWCHMASSLKWWDGYSGQETVIIDDFRYSCVAEIGGLSYLLRVLDRYEVKVEVKGGCRVILSTNYIITCPYPPDVVFTYGRHGDNPTVDEDIG